MYSVYIMTIPVLDKVQKSARRLIKNISPLNISVLKGTTVLPRAIKNKYLNKQMDCLHYLDMVLYS